jgi:nitrate/nitrite transporter NarK
MFAAIYHPVGTTIVVSEAVNRGRTLAFNGVCGNLGVAVAAGLTAILTAWIGWRSAFLIPAVICIVTGIAYLLTVPDDRHTSGTRSASPEVSLAVWMMVAVFALFVLIGISAGLVFNTVTIALPKLIDERIGSSVSLVAVGSSPWDGCWRNFPRTWCSQRWASCNSSVWSGWSMRPAPCCSLRSPSRWPSSTRR